jgi:hypothetical protein
VSPFETCGASGTPIGIFSDIRNELKKIVSLILFQSAYREQVILDLHSLHFRHAWPLNMKMAVRNPYLFFTLTLTLTGTLSLSLAHR